MAVPMKVDRICNIAQGELNRQVYGITGTDVVDVVTKIEHHRLSELASIDPVALAELLRLHSGLVYVKHHSPVVGTCLEGLRTI
jgi:hypothetical protein